MKPLIILIFLCCFSSCVYSQEDKQQKDPIYTPELRLDTSTISIISIKENPKSYEFKMTQADLQLVDSILIRAIGKHNQNADTMNMRWDCYITLDSYKRQYLPFLDNGEKKVLVNCFSRAFAGFDYWKQSLVSVDGGGKNFFSLIINLTTKKYYDFWINAPI